MKTLMFVILSVLALQKGFAQDDQPPFKKDKTIPNFEIEKTDKTIFSSSKLKKNVPVIIMFFSPTCEHCLHQMDEMVKRSNDLKKFQFVLATYQPEEELVAFNQKYKITKYPNFVTGRDTKYFLPPYYQISNFPFLAYYDKNGKLLGSTEGTVSVDDMLKRMK
ncbi:MAG: redoxin domain-containing protein [Flavitalea sp.]